MKTLHAGLLIVMLVMTTPVYAQEVIDLQTIHALAAKGDRQTALAKLNDFIATNPEDLQGRFLKGLLLLEEGNTVAAKGMFAEIARLFPRLPEAFNNLAAIYAVNGEYEKARQALLSAIANEPRYAVAQSNLGDLYIKLAADAYRKAVELDPDNPASVAKLKLLEQIFATGG